MLKNTLKGKVAVITGGGGTLCSEMGKELGKLGVRVVPLGRSIEKLQKVCDEIDRDGGESLPLSCDVTSKESVEEAKTKILKKFGQIDILINGAGGNQPNATTGPDRSFFELDPSAFNKIFDLNFVGTLIPCQVFGEELVKSPSSSILNVSSMSAILPLTKVGGYSASKAAIDNFTRWLAVHMSQNYSKSIRVNAIAPGFFLSDQNRFLLTNKDGSPTERGKTILSQTPMDRYGKPEELIGTVIWLLSDSARFVHGTVVAIDGGFSAFSGV